MRMLVRWQPLNAPIAVNPKINFLIFTDKKTVHINPNPKKLKITDMKKRDFYIDTPLFIRDFVFF